MKSSSKRCISDAVMKTAETSLWLESEKNVLSDNVRMSPHLASLIQPSRRGSYRNLKERTDHLNPLDLHLAQLRDCLQQVDMLDNIKPVWQRSRSITQMLRVTTETAIETSVKIFKIDGQTYKFQATESKASLPGGSATASLTIPV